MPEESLLYIGSYTKTEKTGIRLCAFDPSSGSLRVLRSWEAENPSYLTFSADKKYLFAVYETSQTPEGEYGGSVASYRMGEDGSLEFECRIPTRGRAPCHVSLSEDGRALFAANYSDGSVLIASVDGGRLKELNLIKHEGRSVTPRQTGPHAHFALERGGLLYVCDLGIDKVMVYRPEGSYASVSVAAQIELSPGAGPRHLCFSDDGRLLYIVSELSCEVFAYSVDGTRYELIQALPACDLSEGANTCAAIHASPDGGHIAASNRGRDTLRVFRRDPASGRVGRAGDFPAGGKTPRDFAFDPSGKFVLCANQDSDNVTVHAFDERRSRLTQIGSLEGVNSPVFVRFLP